MNTVRPEATCATPCPSGFAAEHVDEAGMVGSSPAMRELRRQLSRAAGGQRSVLLVGERGTGKELAARAVHARRGQGLFVAVDCAAAPPDMSWREELVSSRGGVLFLDELGALHFDLQATLAEALEARRRAGADFGGAPLLVASSCEEPEALTASGRLRADVLRELGATTLRVPPLRERIEDLPDLVRHFLGSFCLRRGSCLEGMTGEALGALAAWSWPGNVRELRRIVDAAVMGGHGGSIELWDLPKEFHALAPAEAVRVDPLVPGQAPALLEQDLAKLPTLAEMEARLVQEALRRAAGNKSKAARALGISRHKLYEMLRR